MRVTKFSKEIIFTERKNRRGGKNGRLGTASRKHEGVDQLITFLRVRIPGNATQGKS